MIQLPFPSIIEAQLRNVTFLTMKTVVRKIQKHNGQTDSCAWTRQCLDKGDGDQCWGNLISISFYVMCQKLTHEILSWRFVPSMTPVIFFVYFHICARFLVGCQNFPQPTSPCLEMGPLP